MKMAERAKANLGKVATIETKAGCTYDGILEKVEDDGEVIVKVTFGPMVFIAGESIESISIPQK